jgi:DNA polymerase-3 subunit epsilon/CBS domain-containing protein
MLKALNIGGTTDLDALAEAQGVFLDLVLDQQLMDIAQGLPATNTVVINRLSRADRTRLRTALEAVGHLDAFVQDLLIRQ